MSNKNMWSYWRDKYGVQCALEDYFPELLSDPRISLALASIQNAEAAIDAVFASLPDEEVE